MTCNGSIDIIGSSQLVADTPPMQAVELLNRFFAVIVEEVGRRQGLVNKFKAMRRWPCSARRSDSSSPATQHCRRRGPWHLDCEEYLKARPGLVWPPAKWLPATSAPSSGSNTP